MDDGGSVLSLSLPNSTCLSGRLPGLSFFFDLVFVVVISELAHYLSKHISPAGALGYTLLFIPVWWTWIGGTFYNSRFETSDLSYRLITYLQMLPWKIPSCLLQPVGSSS